MVHTQLSAACPHCGARHSVQPAFVGKQARCPACKQVFQVVVSSEASSPTASETLSCADSATDSHQVDPAPKPAPNPVGSNFGRFVLRQLLGQGAFGRVYRAHDPHLDRFVALKIPTFASGDAAKVQRFLTEAKAAARLRHPNIVPIYESGQVGGKYYIAAQFVDGQTLAKRLAQNPPDFRQAAEWARQLAEALAYAHGEGVIHRDIKPDNIMLDEKSAPQIMDFGLAKRLNDDSAMTTDGALLGTPAYMSPEQARGDVAQVGPASDQYGLGVVLYEMLTGKRPFEGPPHSVIAQVVRDDPPRPRSLSPAIPPHLEAICLKAISKQPASRYETARELANDLNAWLQGEPTAALPLSPAGRAARLLRRYAVSLAVLAALAVLAIGGIITFQRNRTNTRDLAAVASMPQATPPPAAVLPSPDDIPSPKTEATPVEQTVPDSPEKSPASSNPPSPAPVEPVPPPAPTSPGAVAPTPGTTQAHQSQVTQPNEQLVRVEGDYRAEIAKIQKLIREGDSKTAETALKELPADRQQTWEVRYLARRARGVPVMSFVATPGIPRSLRYSNDGKHLLVGGGSGRGGNPPWNTLYSLEEKKPIKLSATAGRTAGGRVGAFSHDCTLVMSVRNDAARGEATPLVWNVETPTRPAKELTTLKGLAIDCVQTPDLRWRILTTSLSDAAASGMAILEPPLVLWDLSGEAPVPTTVCENEFFAACFSQDRKSVHVLAIHDGQTCWERFELPVGPLEHLPVGPPLSVKKQMVNGPYDSLHDWRVTASGSLVFTAAAEDSPGLFVFLNPAKRPRLEGPVNHLAATFDQAGERLFVASAEDATLRVYDPASLLAARPIISVPLFGAFSTDAGWIGIELGPTPGQIAVAIDDALTLFDVPLAR